MNIDSVVKIGNHWQETWNRWLGADIIQALLPTPYLTLSAPETNPITLSWNVNGADDSAVASYQVNYQVEDTPGYWSTQRPLANVPANVHSIQVAASNHTGYQFQVVALNAYGASVPASSTPFASVTTAFPSVTGTGPDDDPNLYDGGATLPCLPPTSPQELITGLLLQGELCGNTAQQVYWQQFPPVDGALCPSLSSLFPAAIPNVAVLTPTDKVCQDLGGSGLVMAGQNGQGLRARARAAAASIAASPAAGVAASGAAALERKVEQMMDASAYGQAFGYTRGTRSNRRVRVAVFVSHRSG